MKTGDRVRLSEDVTHKEFAGMGGIIKKIIKARGGEIVVLCDNGKKYRANKENVTVEMAQ